MTAVLERLQGFEQREVEVDGLTYREGLNAVQIRGGVAGNVIPDECAVHVNYRFAPDKSPEQAEALMRDLFEGFEMRVVDLSPAARPGLDLPAAQDFVAADPNKCHTDDEFCPVADLDACAEALRRWLR